MAEQVMLNALGDRHPCHSFDFEVTAIVDVLVLLYRHLLWRGFVQEI
jgi:hypothetical protein